jgi:hypothetical protein
MLIDCDTCAVRGHGCADCVMTVLLGAPPAGVELDATEQAAIGALAEHGLVPPLRLVPQIAGSDTSRFGCVQATG